MSGAKDILELSTQIIRPIIYYIPNGSLPEFEEQYADILQKIKIINSLMLFDINGDFHPFENKIEQIELLKKEKVLKSNTLKLIEFKAKHDIETFKYQFADYLKDLEDWVSTSDYIRKHAKNNTINYFDELQPYLELQYNNLKDHQTEIKQRFANVIMQPSLDESLSVINTNIAAFNIPENESIKAGNINSVKTEMIKPKKQKPMLPSDIEIDHYLLETVFGVDFSNKNN